VENDPIQLEPEMITAANREQAIALEGASLIRTALRKLEVTSAPDELHAA
jgi:hypothetical protein